MCAGHRDEWLLQDMWEVDAVTLAEFFATHPILVVLWHKAQEDAKIIPIINEEIRLHKERGQ